MQTNGTYKFDLILLCGVWLFFYYMFELFTDEIVLFHNSCLDADFKEHFVLFHIEQYTHTPIFIGIMSMAMKSNFCLLEIFFS